VLVFGQGKGKMNGKSPILSATALVLLTVCASCVEHALSGDTAAAEAGLGGGDDSGVGGRGNDKAPRGGRGGEHFLHLDGAVRISRSGNVPDDAPSLPAGMTSAVVLTCYGGKVGGGEQAEGGAGVGEDAGGDVDVMPCRGRRAGTYIFAVCHSFRQSSWMSLHSTGLRVEG
jgi:hypothetical protein